MFRFEQPLYLYALVLLPLLVVGYVVVQRRVRTKVASWGDRAFFNLLSPDRSTLQPHLKFGLWCVALVLLLLAAANPEFGTHKEKVRRKGLDVMFLLDISRSMLAQDVAPSRLERARLFGQRLLEDLKGNRFGIIVFAGNPYLQMPLTTDYAAATVFLKSASPEQAPTQGTAIAAAVNLARESFEKDARSNGNGSANDGQRKIIIIVTDGEDHAGKARDAVKAATDKGAIVFTLGVGTNAGSTIPTFLEPTNTEGGLTTPSNATNANNTLKDEQGQTVVTKLDEPMLRDLAEAGGAQYFNLTADYADIVPALRKAVDKLERREFESRMFSAFNSYYPYLIVVALGLLLLEGWLGYRRTHLESFDLFAPDMPTGH